MAGSSLFYRLESRRDTAGSASTGVVMYLTVRHKSALIQGISPFCISFPFPQHSSHLYEMPIPHFSFITIPFTSLSVLILSAIRWNTISILLFEGNGCLSLQIQFLSFALVLSAWLFPVSFLLFPLPPLHPALSKMSMLDARSRLARVFD